MTAKDLMNMFLRLEMASKEEESDFLFSTGKDSMSPFAITGVHLDEDGDICLESDARVEKVMSPRELAEAVSAFSGNRTVYFMSIDSKGEPELYNIKDGGTRDRLDPEMRMVMAGTLLDTLRTLPADRIPKFESGTINFTINSVYTDSLGALCIESNEIDELDDYPVSMLIEELEAVSPETRVYLYDDEAGEFYGIYEQESRIDGNGDPWINVR